MKKMITALSLVGLLSIVSCKKQTDDLGRVLSNKPTANLTFKVKYSSNPKDTLEGNYNANNTLECNYVDSLSCWNLYASTMLPILVLEINMNKIGVGTTAVGTMLNCSYTEVFSLRTYESLANQGSVTISSISVDSLFSGSFNLKLVNYTKTDSIRFVSGTFKNVDFRIKKQ